MTENYIVFVEQPFKLDIIKLATAYFRGVSWGSCLKFYKDDIVSWYIVPKIPNLRFRKLHGHYITRDHIMKQFVVPYSTYKKVNE